MTSTVGNQITTFKNAGANIFRLPIGAQYLTNNNIAQLDPTALNNYKILVQQVTNTGAYAIIDLHNYARWNGQIFGQGGPSNAQFANLWSLIAKQFAGNSKVLFGINNEPHDIPSMSTWASTLQSAVTAIRQAGATSQYILLPGQLYSHPSAFLDGTNNPLLNVKDSDGTTSKLLFDAHQYLDSDGSGTHTTCTTNSVSTLTSFNSWLASRGRQAILSETGGSSDSSCVTDLSQELNYVKGASNIIGFTAWSAGVSPRSRLDRPRSTVDVSSAVLRQQLRTELDTDQQRTNPQYTVPAGRRPILPVSE